MVKSLKNALIMAELPEPCGFICVTYLPFLTARMTYTFYGDYATSRPHYATFRACAMTSKLSKVRYENKQ
jgi:hypothetical protein